MRAFAFTLFIFLFWALVGRAVLALARDRVGVLRSWLLAPAVGMGLTVLALMIGNQAGAPIGHFARPLTILMGLGAIAILVKCRPLFPGRSGLLFAAIALAGMAWLGWPMFHFGFHWTAYVNDDYLNYCLAAERFRDFGFYRVPTVEELMGRDYTQYFWFVHVIRLMRFGSEHMVAWTAGLAGLRAVMTFMPTIVAQAGAQILAAAGLVLHRGRWRPAAKLTALALVFSPLFIFGAVYQLIAQVGGLALTLAFVALGTRRLPGRKRQTGLRAALPLAVVGSAMAVVYPEVSPFGWLAIALALALEAIRRRGIDAARAWQWAATILISVLLLRHNLLSYGYTLALQTAHGLIHADLVAAVFPFFLIPSGLSSLFGLQGMSAFPPEPWASLAIVLGLVLLIVSGISGLRLFWRGEPLGALLLVDVAVGVSLFRNANDFGLYKLAMYFQPAALGALAWWATANRRRAARLAAAAAYFALIVPVGWRYVRGSLGGNGPIINELIGASDRVAHNPPLPGPPGVWGSGLDNVGGAKFAAEEYRGTEVRFLDRYYFSSFGAFELDYNTPFMWLNPHRDLYPAGHKLLRAIHYALDKKGRIFDASFINMPLPPKPAGFVAFPGSGGLFNKIPAPLPDPGTLFAAVPASRAHNLALFVDSSRGGLYYQPDSMDLSHIGLFQREYDVFQPEGGIYALGAFLLLRVENPSDAMYVRVLATKSNKGRGGTHWMGTGVVMGRDEAPLTFVGDGAGNVFAGPVHPLYQGGAAFLAVDFRETPSRVFIPRTGFNRLYHLSVPLDYRRVVGFGRDISILTPEEFARLEPPRALVSPHQLVTDPGLQYSGLYEDGWVSGTAYLVLAHNAPSEALRVQGYAPLLPGVREPQHVTLSVNGEPLPPIELPPGVFDWLIPIPPGGRATRLDIVSRNPPTLPGGDGRPISAHLGFAGLVPIPRRFSFENAQGPRPFVRGVDTDGWAERSAGLILPSGPAEEIRLRIAYPNWGQVPAAASVRASADGGAPRDFSLAPGENQLVLPLTPGRGSHTVRLQCSSDLRLPAPDSRRRSYQLLSAEFLP